MKKWICVIGMAVILSVCLVSCTHLEKPKEIVGKNDVHFDWGKKSPEAKDRAKHVIEGKRPFEWWYFVCP